MTADIETGRGAEIVPAIDSLAEIDTYDQALEWATSQGVVIDAKDLADGFVLVKDKSRLIGTPFIIVDVIVKDSDFGSAGEYVVCRFISKGGFKGVFVDGSTGIKDQLIQIDRNIASGDNIKVFVRVDGGLVQSIYDTTDSDGNDIKGMTYYLDTNDPAKAAETGHIS